MLQQTQVATVLSYFGPFVRRFPDVDALAAAEVDEVLHLWSGLGYYARARNLHRAARAVCERHGGELPGDIEGLTGLPGIGRSTAGAILALSRDERHPILDANVQRVLCRYHAIDGWPGESPVRKRLWTLAERHTPRSEVAAYTQAIMDLGATLCVRRRPVCALCPLESGCRARAERRQHELPAPRPKRERPQRRTAFLILRDAEGAFLLERRPPSGVWGGLFGFPECPPDPDVRAACEQRFGVEVKERPAPRRPAPRLHPLRAGYRAPSRRGRAARLGGARRRRAGLVHPGKRTRGRARGPRLPAHRHAGAGHLKPAAAAREQKHFTLAEPVLQTEPARSRVDPRSPK